MNSEAATDAARAKLPVKRLLEQHGGGPREAGEKWSSFKCPFCGKKGAGVHDKAGIDLFHCFHTSCPSKADGKESKDEAALMALLTNTSRRDGWMAWIKEAGVWQEERLSPSVMPGTRPRKAKPILESDPVGAPVSRVDNQAPSGGQPGNLPTHLPSADTSAGGPPGSGDGRGGGCERGDAGGPPERDGPPDSRDGATTALRVFFERIQLSEAHATSLRDARGFTDETIRRFGFRSSVRTNRTILEAMRLEFSDGDLVSAGLYVARDDEIKPNAQFCGWGVVGKKSKEDDGETAFLWDWCEPVLIPYFNGAGDLVFLRPHKGMGRKSTPAGVPRFFVVRGRGEAEPKRKVAVICEGELKACALHQVLPGNAVGSLPGITMAKHQPIQHQMLRWLRWSGVKKVVVVFDNEEKGDSRLPAYKEDPARRFEADVWARFLARWLKAKGFKALVGRLPDAWRDERGKADWDGALAGFTRGRLEGDVLAAFQRVLDTAVPAEDTEQLALFVGQQQEQIIRNRLVRLEYEPLLPFGADHELDIAKRLDRAASDREWVDAIRARALAGQFREVLGWYYRRAPVKFTQAERAQLGIRRTECERVVSNSDWDSLDTAARHGLQVARDRLEFYKQLALGPPDGVADFRMDAKFAVVKPNGERELLVRLHNRIKSAIVVLDQHSFTAPRDFKEWTAKNGPFTWMTGETELELLRHDMNQLSAFREVHAVASFGWHASSRLWFAADCAIDPKGTMLLPDLDGVLWYNGLGYRMGNTDWEGESFTMGKPLWRPHQCLQWSADRGLHLADGEEDSKEALQELFASLGTALNDTLGGPEGLMVLGAVLAFVVAPEFFAHEKWFPSLWLHGERGSGKTMLARWLMRIFGFDLEGGISLPNCTRVGMQLAAQQYCNLPVWFEEYQSTLDPAKVEMVKSLYNREPALKKEFGEQRRKIVSNAIITGESTASDSATRQRFPHAQVSDKRRRGNTQSWFEANAGLLFTLGRHVLRNRDQFVKEFYPNWRKWIERPDLAGADERSKQVHGVAYAAIISLNTLLGDPLPRKETQALEGWLTAHIAQSVQDVRADVKVNVFWQMLVDAFKMGVFGRGNEVLRYFKPVRRGQSGSPPKAPQQCSTPERRWMPKWVTWDLFIEFGPVYGLLEQQATKQHRTMPLSRHDLRDQMSKYEYWIPGEIKQRFGHGASVSRCWGVKLDYHPMGYQVVPDEAIEESRRLNGYEEEGDHPEWFDPRMSGDLYEIVFACAEAKDRDRRDKA